ncbi:MAG: chloride channel protein [Butyricicoccus pullicaecorum]
MVVFGLSGSFAAGVGMVAVFCGVTNCPLTSILLAYELFGGDGLLLFALGCAVSYMFSGYSGLYSAQKIMYSKLRPEFIARQSGE